MWPGNAEWNRGKEKKNQGQLWTKSSKTPVRTDVHSWKSWFGSDGNTIVTVWWKEAVGSASRAPRTQAKVESRHFSQPTGTKTTIFRTRVSRAHVGPPCGMLYFLVNSQLMASSLTWVEYLALVSIDLNKGQKKKTASKQPSHFQTHQGEKGTE